MKIRFWLYLFFGVLAVLPIVFLAAWIHGVTGLSEAGLASRSVLTAAGLTLAVAGLVSILLSNLISTPMERMHRAFRELEEHGVSEPIELSRFAVAREQRELEASFNRMVSGLRKTQRRMEQLAYFDETTGLPNRDAMRRCGEHDLALLARQGLGAAVFFIDIDDFKEINDLHGHQTGDQVLRYLAARIADIVEVTTGQSPVQLGFLGRRRDDNRAPRPCLARFGGDEFAIFLPANCGYAQRDSLADQIMAAVTSPLPGLDTSVSLGCSIGISLFPDHGLTFEDLIKRADIAMYHAKKTGKSATSYFGEGTGDISLSEMRRNVQNAIANGEMELFYQPKVNASSDRVDSAEALVRWVHPRKGIINPGSFIPAIENTEISNELGEWVIRRACRDMKAWDEMGTRLDIAVNIAARQFVSDNFVARIHHIVTSEGCDPRRFEIEITEETALANHEQPSETIAKLQDFGFKVSLDDYGRGYSNLSRLSELRVNTLKIDGPLTARLTRDERTRVIFEATINMARGLGCKTVAEGVETEEEAKILRKLGCSELQGFYYATPLPVSSFNSWLEMRRNGDAAKVA